MNKIIRSLILPAIAALALGGASASAEAACLSNGEVQQAISSGEILRLDQVLSQNGLSQKSLVAVPSVCEKGGQLFYELSVMDKNGNARKLQLNARTGAS